MRAQDTESDIKNNITRHSSILDIDFLSIAPAGFLDSYIPKIKQVLSSPESAVLLYDLWDIEHTKGKCLDKEDKHAEHAFSTVMKRKSENAVEGSIYSQMVDLYLRADIKRWFNISILEWLNLTIVERDMLLKHAKLAMERTTKAFAEAENSTNEAKKELKKTANEISDIGSLMGD